MDPVPDPAIETRVRNGCELSPLHELGVGISQCTWTTGTSDEGDDFQMEIQWLVPEEGIDAGQ